MINSVLFYSLFLIWGDTIAGVPAGQHGWNVVYDTLEQCQDAGNQAALNSTAYLAIRYTCVPSQGELDD